MEQIMVTIPKRPEDIPTSQTMIGMQAGNLDTEPLTNSVPNIAIQDSSTLYRISKRFCDIVLSLIGMIVLIPVFLVIGICIKLVDGGPILHFREVIGEHGRRFHALKFRTMILDADTYLAKHPDLMRKFQQNMKLASDPRITRFGKFLRKTSLDELPQLFNVLIGQMSLVGPRMIHPSELPRYGEYAQKRLSVKPGITGLWQISGRQHISYDERVMLDMRYIDTRSFIVDLVLLVKTLKVFVVHTGA
ncbi:MAG TPA: sugar transferase [Ktedonobacteraceae bacterium]|nr:sugar transferase [Ktedonobacteraceae bacterium]